MKKNLSFIVILFIFLLSLLGCSAKTVDQPKKEDQGSKGVFYEVHYNDNTVYLFGSIHIGVPKLYPLHEKIDAAYDASDYLAVEMDINDLKPEEMIALISEIGVYNDGTTIQDHVSTELYDELIRSIKDFGLQEEGVVIFKPWLVSDMLESLILEKAGYDLDLGIDQYFLKKAAIEKKEIISLETIEDQLGLYTILTPKSQEKALHSTLFDQDENQEKIAELMEMWIAGDINRLAELRILEDEESEDYQAYYEALTVDRDLKMTAKIEDFLKNGQSETYFVVVGALHLVGDNSIADLLKLKGYDVKKVIE